jgi:predicted alpha/beta-fold hydrolase
MQSYTSSCSTCCGVASLVHTVESMQDTPFNSAIVDRCPMLQQIYQVLPWFWNGHVETLFATITRRHPRLKYNRQLVRMEDGGVVALDFEPLAMDKVPLCPLKVTSLQAPAYAVLTSW